MMTRLDFLVQGVLDEHQNTPNLKGEKLSLMDDWLYKQGEIRAAIETGDLLGIDEKMEEFQTQSAGILNLFKGAEVAKEKRIN